jgi:hypothetical protein
VQSNEPIFIPLDLNIEHREIHWKPLSKKNGIMWPEMENTHEMARPPHNSG